MLSMLLLNGGIIKGIFGIYIKLLFNTINFY